MTLEINKQIRESCKVNGTNHDMVCTICSKKLGILVESDKKSKILDKLTKYQCICDCGGDSFVVRTHNTCYMVPEQNMIMVKRDFDIKPDYVEYKIFLKENK